ncbi:transposable element Tc1 transposase [Trichonephila clavipes]|nr:transposable element Tc1 transposase [Trichonephila clavipes]
MKTDNFWKNVIFSDESKFNIFGSDGRRTVWRKPNTALDPKNLHPTVKHGGVSVCLRWCLRLGSYGIKWGLGHRTRQRILLAGMSEGTGQLGQCPGPRPWWGTRFVLDSVLIRSRDPDNFNGHVLLPYILSGKQGISNGMSTGSSTVLSYLPLDIVKMGALGSLVVRALDSRLEGLGSMPDATEYPSSTHAFDVEIVEVEIDGASIYRPFGEFCRAKSHCHLHGVQGQRQAYF